MEGSVVRIYIAVCGDGSGHRIAEPMDRERGDCGNCGALRYRTVLHRFILLSRPLAERVFLHSKETITTDN